MPKQRQTIAYGPDGYIRGLQANAELPCLCCKKIIEDRVVYATKRQPPTYLCHNCMRVWRTTPNLLMFELPCHRKIAMPDLSGRGPMSRYNKQKSRLTSTVEDVVN